MSSVRWAMAIGIAIVAGCWGNVFGQDCPAYTHRDDVVIGDAASLPEGWVVYRKGTVSGGNVSWGNGLYRSAVGSFGEMQVSGTEGHKPTSMDISPDGKWVVYLNQNDGDIYLVPSAGGTPVRVPYVNFNEASLPLRWTGFYRGSPNGLEIFYHDFNWQGDVLLCAIPVDVSGKAPSFGTARKLVASQPPGGVGFQFTVWIQSGSFAVWKDQVFGIFMYPNNTTMNGFVTIPENGAGVANADDFYQFSELPPEDYWGCGQTMSPDGLYCASNSALIGSSCVPNKLHSPDPMDHKGFYITRFLRDDMPAIAIDDQIEDPEYGVSINWCPEQYRIGDDSQIDFTNYNFSNSNEYLVGVLKGTAIPQLELSYGIWVIHWSTSTWTQMSPNTTTTIYDEPAAYFPGLSSVEDGREARATRSDAHASVQQVRVTSLRRSVEVPKEARGVALLDVSGRMLWRRPVQNADGTEVSVPQRLRGRTLVVRYEWVQR